MGISSYTKLLDEYSEHNFCTSSSSSKAFVILSHIMSTGRMTNKQQTRLLLLFQAESRQFTDKIFH